VFESDKQTHNSTAIAAAAAAAGGGTILLKYGVDVALQVCQKSFVIYICTHH